MLCCGSYGLYAYILGKKGLVQGLAFSSKARKKLFDFRRDFILGKFTSCLEFRTIHCHAVGNFLFFVMLVGAAIFVNQASRCIDQSGITIFAALFLGHGVFHFTLWVLYVPGIHRSCAEWLIIKWRSCTEALCFREKSNEEQPMVHRNVLHVEQGTTAEQGVINLDVVPAELNADYHTPTGRRSSVEMDSLGEDNIAAMGEDNTEDDKLHREQQSNDDFYLRLEVVLLMSAGIEESVSRHTQICADICEILF